MTKKLKATEYITQGNKLRKEGNIEIAIEKYHEALKHDSEFTPAFFQLAVTYEKILKLEQAISYYKRVIKIQRDNHDVYVRLARVMKKQGYIQESILYFQKAITLEPTQPVWVYTSLGDCFSEIENYNEALKAYQKAIHIDSSISSSVYKKLLDISKNSQDPNCHKIIEICQQAISMGKNEDRVDFHLLLANSYFQLGQIKKTISAYQAAIKYQPHLPFEAYISLGKVLKQQRKSINIKNTKKYEVVICTTFKNEAPYILEWIAYHRVIGVDHFILYDNDSTDRTPDILQHLEQAGLITYVHWPNNPRIEDNQLAAYKDAYLKLIGRCKWAAFIDADEFILPIQHKDIKSLLLEFEDEEVAGIAINWKLFGSSGHALKHRGLLMERFQRCAESNFLFNRRFKTIARVDKIEDIITVHSCKFSEGVHVYPDRALVPKSFSKKNPYINHDIAQINHYFTKSKAEWNLKRSRGRATRSINNPEKVRPEKSFDFHDRNEDEDLKILKFLEETKNEIQAISEMAGLEAIIQKMNDEYTDFQAEIYELTKYPQFTENATQFIENFLKQNPKAKILEFGSGASTIWLAQRNKNIISIEHDLNWYESVKSVLDRECTEPIDLRLLPRPYHLATYEFDDEFFDLIIVDGCERLRCIENSMRILKKGGVLLVNHGHEDDIRHVHFLLQGWDYTRTLDSRRATHWWRKPLEDKSSYSELAKVLRKSQVRLYTGTQMKRAKQEGWIGVSSSQSDEEQILYDWQKPFPLPDEIVDVFFCEDFLQRIPPDRLLTVVFPELYRILKPGGVLRISVPDYNNNVLWNRSWKNKQGKPYFDPTGGGRWNPSRKQVTHGGYVWFPTYEKLKSSIELSPLRNCQTSWLHYYTQDGDAVLNNIDRLNHDRTLNTLSQLNKIYSDSTSMSVNLQK